MERPMSQVLATRVENLQDLCTARLRDCLDPRSTRFARQVRGAAWVPAAPAETLAGSAICLIGLGRAGIPRRAVLPDPAALCRQLAAAVREEAEPGALGLVLWANSAMRALAPLALLAEAGFAPEEIDLILPGLTTTELAWLASGLLHAAVPALRPATIAALRELESRLDRKTLLFVHASRAAPLRRRLRRHVADFSDQVFPLQALAFAATVLGDPERRLLADRVGSRMVAAQGPLGQWWAQHDASRGEVAERYPVLAAQQHSIGPMALRALALAGGRNHAAAASASRAWLHSNELGFDLVEPATGIIWQGLERDEGRMAQRLRQARVLAGLSAPDPVAPRLRLVREMLPRDWGWLLYASALEGGERPDGHIF
jgi:hypothetical protein